MKTIKAFLYFIPILSVISCSKDMLSGEELKNTDKSDNIFKTEFRIGFEPGYDITTKATGETDIDNFIGRIDMYEFDSDGNNIRHEIWADPDGLDLSTVTPESYDAYGNRHNWVFFANLSEDTADYLSKLNADEIGRTPEGVIPLDAGNFIMHKPVMAGTARSYFHENEVINVVLYRYLTRIDILNITADFDDPDIMNKTVKLEKVAIVNYPNALKVLSESAREVWGSSQSIWGVGYLKFSDPAFGNLLRLETACNDISIDDYSGKFNQAQFGGIGSLAQDHSYLLNYNKGSEKGMLEISATGDQLESSVHTFGTSEGVLCSPMISSSDHTLEINGTLYTVPLYRNSYSDLWCDKRSQDDTQKLVLEVSIDGEMYYYIISLRELEAGRIYNVRNITLKGYGSEYSNFYEKKYETETKGFEIEGWPAAIEIDNIEVGIATDDKPLN